MSIQVRYFASVREALGDGETVPSVAGETIGALRQRLMAASPQHETALSLDRALRASLNHVLCGPDVSVPDGAEVAFFPPVTGG